MCNPVARAHEVGKAMRRRRNPVARLVLDPAGPFKQQVKPARRAGRHPRHRLRFMAEVMG